MLVSEQLARDSRCRVIELGDSRLTMESTSIVQDNPGPPCSRTSHHGNHCRWVRLWGTANAGAAG